MDLYSNIKRRRTELGMTQDELAKKMGYSEKSMISKIENGKIDLPQSKIVEFANALGTTPSILMGWREDRTEMSKKKSPDHFRIPVLGHVAAGIPIEMIDDVIDFEDLRKDEFRCPEKEYFGLKIEGHSMEPKICDGDVVIVHSQNDAEDDQIVIAAVNGDHATCKRLKRYADSLTLVPINPAFDPMTFTAREIIEKPVTILGIVVELRRKFL